MNIHCNKRNLQNKKSVKNEVISNCFKEYTLNSLAIGQCGRVKQLKVDGSMRRRLQDIGLIEGTMVECVQKSPAGDPVAYLIRGAIIAIRTEDSRKVLIHPIH